MNEFDRELVFSEAVKAGKRIYYFDVKKSKNGDRYISITESKKIVEGSYENPHISFEKHKLFLYKEDYEKFVDALTRTLDVAKTGIVPDIREVAPIEKPASSYVEEQYSPQPVQAVVAEPEAAAEPAPVATQDSVSEPVAEDNTFKIDLDF